MKALRWSLIAGAAAIAAAALAPLFPLDEHRARIEREAAERIGERVSIGRLTAWLLPLPHLAAKDVTVGQDADLKAGEIVIRPRLGSLLSDRKTIRVLELRDVSAGSDRLKRLIALAALGDEGKTLARVERIVFDDAVLHARQTDFGPFDADVRLTSTGQPERALLRSQDGQLHAELVPEGDRYAVSVEARDWELPWGPRLRFDRLEMKGTAEGGVARFDDAVAEAYGGDARGELRIAWKDAIEVSGALTLSKMQLAKLLAAFSKESPVTGRLDAEPKFRMRAGTGARLRDTLRLDGPFQVHDAVLRGIDLQAAASLTRQDRQTGDTRFDRLSGALTFERGAYRFSNIKAVSGAVGARGDVAVGARKTLSGRVYAQLQPIGAAAEVPLNISGTVDAPVIAPSGAAVAGAAVGTAVMGPGIGTAAGAKLGQIAEELLGGGEKKSKD